MINFHDSLTTGYIRLQTLLFLEIHSHKPCFSCIFTCNSILNSKTAQKNQSLDFSNNWFYYFLSGQLLSQTCVKSQFLCSQTLDFPRFNRKRKASLPGLKSLEPYLHLSLYLLSISTFFNTHFTPCMHHFYHFYVSNLVSKFKNTLKVTLFFLRFGCYCTLRIQ